MTENIVKYVTISVLNQDNPNAILFQINARIHHCRLKKFNPSSIARFLDPTIKLNLHNSRIDFNRYSPFNFVCKKSRIGNCFVFHVTHWQGI